MDKMLVTTTDSVPGKSVVTTIGLVKGNTIRARHVGRDVMAWGKSIIGGEIKGYTGMMVEARDEAIDRMIEEARARGGNAVIGARLTTSMIMQNASEVLAYGTAVVLE